MCMLFFLRYKWEPFFLHGFILMKIKEKRTKNSKRRKDFKCIAIIRCDTSAGVKKCPDRRRKKFFTS